MKHVVIIIVTLALTFTSLVIANAEPRTLSHLPIELKQFLDDELSNPKTEVESELTGEFYMEFYVDESCQIQVIGLSSSNIELGEFVKKELEMLSGLNINCPKGITYFVKVRVNYQ